jgi:hypothetical protein
MIKSSRITEAMDTILPARRRHSCSTDRTALRWAIGVALWICVLLVLCPLEGAAVASAELDREAFEGVYMRPFGSRAAFAWKADSRVERGEWRIHRGAELDRLTLVDSTPSRRGLVTYRWEAERPLLGREFFRLTFRAADGVETVMATVLLVGTDMSTVQRPLPDGPPPAVSATAPGWRLPAWMPQAIPDLEPIPRPGRPAPDTPPPEIDG